MTSKTLSLICAAFWVAGSGYVGLHALAMSELGTLAAISIVVVSNAGMFLALARANSPVADKSVSVLVQSSSESVIPSVSSPGHRRVS